MIKKITIPVDKSGWGYDLSDGIFARVQTDEGIVNLRVDVVNKYWDYVNEDVEGISAWTNGKNVIVEFSVASGQGGAVTVWNEKGEMLHISNAEFGVASTLFDGYVYTLRAVIYFRHPLSYSMTRVPFGTMDAWSEEHIEFDESFIFENEKVYDESIAGTMIDLNVHPDKYIISYGEEKDVISKTRNAWVKGLYNEKDDDKKVRINTEGVTLITFEGWTIDLKTRSVVVTAERIDDVVKVTRKRLDDESVTSFTEEQRDIQDFENIINALASIEIKAVRHGTLKDTFVVDDIGDISDSWSLRIGYSDGHKVDFNGEGVTDSTFLLISELLTKNISLFRDVSTLFSTSEIVE